MSPDDAPVTRRELDQVVVTIDERARTMEARLTTRMVLVVAGTNVVLGAISPSIAAGVTALGLGGFAIVKAIKLAATFYLS